LGVAPNRQQIEDAILLAFRALSISWAWVSFPDQRKFISPSAAASATVLRSLKTTKFAVCEASASAALAASVNSSDRLRFEAANAIARAGAAMSVIGASGSMLLAHASDANRIEEGVSVQAVAALPIWADKQSPWNFSLKWTNLQGELHNLNRDWDVWTKWYEERLLGKPGNEAVEIVRATLSEEVWGRGTRAINTHIALLVAEFQRISDLEDRPPLDAVPQQVSRALIFGGDETSPIVLVDPPGEGLIDTVDQRQSFADIRERATLLDTSCAGSNRLANLKEFASRLIISMGVSLNDLKVRAFWSQMNSLRHRLEADIRVRSSNDPDSPSLPEDVAAILHDLVDALNVFAAHEPKLTALDELKRDPANRFSAGDTLSAVRTIAEAASVSPQVVSAEAADALVQVTSNASDDTPAAERSKEFSIRSARNLVLEIIRRSYKIIGSEAAKAWSSARDAVYKTGATSLATYATIWFVKSHEPAVRLLIDTLGGNQTLHRIIDLIVRNL
jgi:hypothetical protein